LQAEILPFARAVPPSRPRRIDVRIAAADGRAPIGRSRIFRVTAVALDLLLQLATRLEGGP
jgi:hypothetical protein